MPKNIKSKNEVANVIVASNAETTKAPTKKKRPVAVVAPKNVKLTLHDDGARDCLKGALASRTHAIHAVLVDLANKDSEATMTTTQITNAVNAQWARALNGALTNNASTASHLNTMKARKFVEHGAEARGWRLTAEARKLCAPKS